MKSVGIMSMQRIHNYGSSLQAYALKRLLERASSDVEVRFLDYRPGPAYVGGAWVNTHASKFTRAAAKVREYSSVSASLADKARFFNHKRTYASKYLPLVGVASDIDHDFAVDLQVIGSDEVFNCVQSNPNVGYSRDLFGHESAAKSLVSYAASFGNATLDRISATGIKADVSSDLKRFDRISVRDENSAQIVEELTGTAPEIHLDPTLVHDFFANDLDLIPAERMRAEKYVIAYGYSGRFSAQENKAVRAYADRHGARVLAFGGLQGAADEFVDCSPFELLAYFRDASAVVTDTFHGTIFSILSEVPFATIIRKSSSHGYGNQEKLGYLLRTLGLEGRALLEPASMGETLDSEINFEPARHARSVRAHSAREYIDGIIS